MTSPFDEVFGSLLGDLVDPRELVAKNSPDASALHVQSPLKMKKLSEKETKKRQKRQAQIGLAGNVLGITAGAAALGAASKDPRFSAKDAPGWAKAAAKTGKRIPSPIADLSRKSPRVAAGMAAGAVGLQAANLGGDLFANRVLSREAKKEVKKALGEVTAAYRQGQISKAQFDEIAKLSNEVIYGANMVRGALMNRTVRDMGRNTMSATGRRMKAHSPRQKRRDREILRNSAAAWEKQRPGLERRALIGSGMALAGVSGYAGHRYGKKRGAREANAIQKDLGWVGTISKIDEEKRQVFGWASLSTVNGEPVVDRQMDFIPIEETEKSAYTYVKESRKGGDMHKRVKKGLTSNWDEPLHTSDLIESMVFTKEKIAKMGLPEDALPEGWWVGFQVNDDEQWQLVKDRKRTGFSIHGAGRRREIAHA